MSEQHDQHEPDGLTPVRRGWMAEHQIVLSIATVGGAIVAAVIATVLAVVLQNVFFDDEDTSGSDLATSDAGSIPSTADEAPSTSVSTIESVRSSDVPSTPPDTAARVTTATTVAPTTTTAVPTTTTTAPTTTAPPPTTTTTAPTTTTTAATTTTTTTTTTAAPQQDRSGLLGSESTPALLLAREYVESLPIDRGRALRINPDLSGISESNWYDAENFGGITFSYIFRHKDASPVGSVWKLIYMTNKTIRDEPWSQMFCSEYDIDVDRRRIQPVPNGLTHQSPGTASTPTEDMFRYIEQRCPGWLG